MGPAANTFDFEQLAPAGPDARPLQLDEAALRAQQLINQAQAQAEQLRDQARAAGFEEGVAQGRAEALEKLQPAAAAFAQGTAALRELEARSADAVEREAVELAMQVAEKVVAGALEAEPERVLDVVRGALRAIVERERVVIQVNPDDLELVRGAIGSLSASLGGIEQLEVQEERRVGRGGAVLRTTVGELDARIATKLEQARQSMLAELGG